MLDGHDEPVSVAAAELLDEAARLRAGMAEIDSPEVTMWHNALETLRAINKLKPPSLLFAHRYTRFDHAIGPELEQAHAWINDMHRRFLLGIRAARLAIAQAIGISEYAVL
jgi:hypothetical protein